MLKNINSVVPSLYKVQEATEKVAGKFDSTAGQFLGNTVVKNNDAYDVLLLSGEKNKGFVISQEREEERELFYKDELKDQLVAETSGDSGFDDIVKSGKKEMLDMLVKHSQLLSPQQYTPASWRVFVQLMKEALAATGGQNPKLESLDKGIRLMQRGMAGLRYAAPKKEFANLRKPLPMRDISDKNPTDPKVLAEQLGIPLVEAKVPVQESSDVSFDIKA